MYGTQLFYRNRIIGVRNRDRFTRTGEEKLPFHAGRRRGAVFPAFQYAA